MFRDNTVDIEGDDDANLESFVDGIPDTTSLQLRTLFVNGVDDGELNDDDDDDGNSRLRCFVATFSLSG